MKLWLYILIAIALATGAFVAGYSSKEATTFYDSLNFIDFSIELPDNYTSQSVKEVEKIRYVPYPVQVPVEVEVEVFRELTDWDSIEELEAFLQQDNTDRRIVLKAGSDGVVKFNNQCEDYALQLRDRAMVQGKHLSVAIVELGDNKFHALCMARIGNEFWYVEPQTDECWLRLYLD